MNIKKSKTFRAVVTFGLKRGYREDFISLEEFKLQLVAVQKMIFERFNIQLSTKIANCDIVFSGQDEPSVDISFIQYPKFQYDELKLKESILTLVEILMNALEQNRVVVVFDDETFMLEKDKDQLDPGIDFKQSSD